MEITIEVPDDLVVPWASSFVDPDTGDPAQVLLLQVDRKDFLLLTAIHYTGDTGVDGLPAAALTVRPGDLGRTDLASVPTALKWFVSRYGVHTPAALVHDRLIGDSDMDVVTDVQADRFFRFMLKDLGVRWIRRWMMWAAVALRTRLSAGGWKTYSVIFWAVAALAGLLTAVGAALTTNWTVLAAAAVAPFIFALLWGRQYGAGLVAAYSAPWVLPPTVLGAIGYGVYWCLERVSTAIGRLRGTEVDPSATEPIGYEQF